MTVSIETIRSLADIATEKKLGELVIQSDTEKILIKPAFSSPAMPLTVMQQPSSLPMPVKEAESLSDNTPQPEPSFFKVTATCVGRFRSNSSSGDKPHIVIGSNVAKGQKLGSIECLGQFNELESEVDGQVKEIVVEDGGFVHFGEVIMIIEVKDLI